MPEPTPQRGSTTGVAFNELPHLCHSCWRAWLTITGHRRPDRRCVFCDSARVVVNDDPTGSLGRFHVAYKEALTDA